MTRARPERVILYGRVSSAQQEKQYGLRTQLEACRALAEQQDWEVVAELSDTISGVKATRDGLDQARDLLRTGQATAVVAYHLDRLNRDPAHHYLFLDEMKRLGARVYYTSKGGRPVAETDDDEFLEGIEALLAFRERNRTRIRTLDARRQKARDGALMGNGETPFGYRRTGDRGHTAWEVVEDEAATVRLIYQMYLDGQGAYLIARRLSELQVPTPSDARQRKTPRKRGFAQWENSIIYKVLRSEVYAGTGHTFRHKVAGETESGKKRYEQRPKDQWFSFEVPAIIPREDWTRAQARLDEGRQQAKRNLKYEYLIGRRIYCDSCNTTLQARPSQNGRYAYYACRGRRGAVYSATTGCTLPRVRTEIADNAVWQWVSGVLLDEQQLRERFSTSAEANARARQLVETRRIEIAARLSDAGLKQKRLRKMLLDERITEAEYDEERAELADLETSWTAELSALSAELDSLKQPGTLENVLQLAEQYRVEAEQATFAARRRIVEELDIDGDLYRQGHELRARVLSSAFQVRDDILVALLPE